MILTDTNVILQDRVMVTLVRLLLIMDKVLPHMVKMVHPLVMEQVITRATIPVKATIRATVMGTVSNNGNHYNQPRITSSYPNYSGPQSGYPGGHGHGSGGSSGGGGNGPGQGYSKPSPDAVLLSSLQRGQKRDINAFPELKTVPALSFWKY